MRSIKAETLPPEIRDEIIHTPNPQRGAVIKGLISDFNIRNPYISRTQRGWRRSFAKAFEQGRQLKKKYNYFVQLQFNFNKSMNTKTVCCRTCRHLKKILNSDSSLNGHVCSFKEVLYVIESLENKCCNHVYRY